MPTQRLRSASSRLRLTAIFVGVMLPPALTLVALGFWLLQQDRDLQVQRETDQREAAAKMVEQRLGQFVTDAEQWSPEGEIPENALIVTVSATGLKSYPPGRALWSSWSALQEYASLPFEDAEIQEYRKPDEALAVYRGFALSADFAVRAGALLGLARVERTQDRIKPALDAYRRLATISGIAINGSPADLVARRAICDVLSKAGRNEELNEEVQALEADFLAGRWTLLQADWENAKEDIERWTGRPLSVSKDQRALSAAMIQIEEEASTRSKVSSRNESLRIDDAAVAILWRSQKIVVIGPSLLSEWTEHAQQEIEHDAFRLSLLTKSGELASGAAPQSTGRPLQHSASATGLPWTVVLGPGNTSTQPEFARRRQLLAGGLVAIMALLTGGGYFLWRVIQRELAVARLQTDFVAAVSHEFRTPLTSLRHVTELLDEDDGLPPGPQRDERKEFYAALGRNTQRLHRLVESLLDFSRMETGRKPWKLEPANAGVLVENVVEEFQKELEAGGPRIELEVERPSGFPISADVEALGYALWNLLDNAVKYSPGSALVRVKVESHPDGVAISVSDSGLGIPLQERREIFRKFVRGRRAGELGIKGTGLGLAMVRYIIEAHGGVIELESEEGRGSTFRVVIPCENALTESSRSTRVPSHVAPDA